MPGEKENRHRTAAGLTRGERAERPLLLTEQ
jgi:hypothetical protein